MKQSAVAAYFGPSAASIGVNTRTQCSSVIGQPSTPKHTVADEPSGSPLSRPLTKGGGASPSGLMYRTFAYSKPMPACSMARASGERSV
eukprot:scaffold52342_cov75-Phaeocystis_antarctica.AAC.2